MKNFWSDSAGWRAVIGEDFTFQNVKVLTQAMAIWVKGKGKESRGVVVGYDSRFLSSEFALASACVLAGNGIPVFLTKCEIPTPVVSYEIGRRGASGGISITASHNPPRYNGMKFFSSWDEVDFLSINREIRDMANSLEEVKETSYEYALKDRLIQVIDPIDPYLLDVKSLINVKLIKDARLKVVVDPMYGTGKRYLPRVFQEIGCDVRSIHINSDPLFGDQAPDPKEETLKEMAEVVIDSGAHLGVATDGDADRFGVVDRDGRYIEPVKVFGILVWHLIRSRGWKGVVVKNVATTDFIDAICKSQGIEVIEVPIGFKHISELMRREDVLIGGEDNGGITIRGHIPDKDGILSSLLMAEVVAREGRSIQEILQDLYKEVGTFFYKQISIPIHKGKMDRLLENLVTNPPVSFSGLDVREAVSVSGGRKFMLKDGSWIFFRPSSTEEILRCYIDTDTEEKLQRLIQVGERFIMEA